MDFNLLAKESPITYCSAVGYEIYWPVFESYDFVIILNELVASSNSYSCFQALFSMLSSFNWIPFIGLGEGDRSDYWDLESLESLIQIKLKVN